MIDGNTARQVETSAADELSEEESSNDHCGT